MFKLIKKAFTLVELLIVIAILAVLATVGIVSFASFREKAKISTDTTLVKQLNDYIATNVVDTFNTPYEVMEFLINGKSGIDLAELSLNTGGYHYAFNINDKVQKFYIIDADNRVIDDGEDITDKYDAAEKLDFFAFTKTINDANEMRQAGYSVYLQNGVYQNSDFANWDVGLDVGDNNITAVSYISNASFAKEVTIRTTSGTLNIDAPSDSINHYGFANKTFLKKVSTNSYHVFGTVPYIDVYEGRLVLEKPSNVQVVHFSTRIENEVHQNDFNEIKVALAEGVKLPEFTRDPVNISASAKLTNNGVLVVKVQHDTNPTTDDIDYVYLRQQGVFEQIRVVDKNNNVYQAYEDAVDDDSAKIANDIANCLMYNGVVYSYNDLKVIKLADGTIKGVQVDDQLYVEAYRELQTGDYIYLRRPGTSEKFEEVSEGGISTEKAEQKSLFAGGSGTKNDPYLLSSAWHWNNIYPVIAENSTKSTPVISYFKLASDIDFTNYTIDNTPVFTNHIYEYIDMDGDNHRLINVNSFSSTGSENLFDRVYYINLRNIQINFNIVSKSDYGYAGGILKQFGHGNATLDADSLAKFTNIITTGSITRDTSGFTGVYSSEMYGNVEMKDCINYTNLTSTGYVAVVAPHAMLLRSIKYDNVKNYGTIIGECAGAFIGMGSNYDNRITLANSDAIKNYGKIYGTITAGSYSDYNENTVYGNGIYCNVKGADSATATLTGTVTFAKSTTTMDYGETFAINTVANATKYIVNISFDSQLYNFVVGSNSWGGSFSYQNSKTFTAEELAQSDGQLTGFKKAYVLENKNQKVNFWDSSENVDYEGFFIPEEYDLSGLNKTFDGQFDLYDAYNKSFYYIEMDKYSGLLADAWTPGADRTYSIRISVFAYNGSNIVGYGSQSYSIAYSSYLEYFGLGE